MKAVFADSFFFLALINISDSAHSRAAEISRKLTCQRVTTAWVLTEVADALAHGKNRAAFLDLLAFLKHSPSLTILPPSQDLFDRGVELYARRLDKDWSLTDCISFVVMADEEISDALTADRHFEQAGFNLLLK
ncbi:MAG: PIN domain-containing protein [Verrucomicrobiae bacterium]|nr:PIN domain-containing protein [Verrucomicrobiae bacterium]